MTPSEQLSKLDLHESNLATILNNSLDGIVVIGTDHKVISYNEVACQLMNGNEKPLTAGCDIREVMLRDNLDIYNAAFELTLQGETTEVERKNEIRGTVRWVRHKLSPLTGKDGAVKAVVLASHDIQAEKEFERAARESDLKFQNIFQSVEEAILAVDITGKIVLANAAASSIFEYSSNELRSFNIEEVLPGCKELIDSINRHDSAAEATRKSCTGKSRSGRQIPLELKLSVTGADADKLILICAEDLSEWIEYERKLNKYNHELSLLNLVNDSILGIAEEGKLLQSVCDTVVNEGGYRLAWFSTGNDEAPDDHSIPITCSAGATEYTNGIQLYLNSATPGPSANCILNRELKITNNVTTTQYFLPWLQRALQFGIQSSIALPVPLSDTTCGCLNIYSSQIDAFDELEVKTLKRIADNLSLAIRNRRTEKEKLRAQYELKERIKELRTLYDVNTLLHHESFSLHESLHKIAEILPCGWQYPEICRARIIFEGVEHLSADYVQPVITQSASFTTQDNKSGTIEIGYIKSPPQETEDPFLKEERDLIETLAEMIGVHYNERAAHNELRKSEANLRSVFESTNVGHLLLDKQLRIVAFNEAMQTGYAEGTGIILKKNNLFTESLDADRRSRFAERIEKINSSKQSSQYDVSFERHSKTYHFVVSVYPVLGQSGDIIGYSLSASDITKRKELEFERQRIIEELVARNKDLEQFTFMISHNVRSPIAHILGLTNLLSYDLPDNDKKKATDAIREAAEKLDKVIADTSEILAVKRASAERKSTVNLKVITREVIDGLSTLILQSDALIEYDFSLREDMYAIRTYIQNIITNAITNTLRFAKSGQRPHLQISSDVEGAYCILKFTDHGIGVDTELIGEKLFGIYQRFHTHKDGKGLGLFMIKTQVEIMGGDVSVISKPDEGFQLIVRLPRT